MPDQPAKPKIVNYKKKTKRMNFHVHGDKQTILVRQYWKYNYSTKGGASNWTSAEKRAFHKNIEKVIRAAWGGKFVLDVGGKSDFAKYYDKKRFTVKFDIDPKSSGAHWTVEAIKIPKGNFSRSWVNWGTQTIQLDTEDMVEVDKGGGKGVKQSGAAHEFGHTIKSPDEYIGDTFHRFQKKSIMNRGMQIKKRHAAYLVDQLNRMIPDTRFKVVKVK